MLHCVKGLSQDGWMDSKSLYVGLTKPKQPRLNKPSTISHNIYMGYYRPKFQTGLDVTYTPQAQHTNNLADDD